MTERQNKNYEPTVVESMHEAIAEKEISSFLDLGERQDHNQAELAKTDFLKHFAIALLDSAPLGASARVYVSQQLITTHSGECVRTVFAILEESTEDGMQKQRHIVGRELDGVLLADEPFDDGDMVLALKQLDELQKAVDNGELDLDETLGTARNTTAVIAHGF